MVGEIGNGALYQGLKIVFLIHINQSIQDFAKIYFVIVTAKIA